MSNSKQQPVASAALTIVPAPKVARALFVLRLAVYSWMLYGLAVVLAKLWLLSEVIGRSPSASQPAHVLTEATWVVALIRLIGTAALAFEVIGRLLLCIMPPDLTARRSLIIACVVLIGAVVMGQVGSIPALNVWSGLGAAGVVLFSASFAVLAKALSDVAKEMRWRQAAELADRAVVTIGAALVVTVIGVGVRLLFLFYARTFDSWMIGYLGEIVWHLGMLIVGVWVYSKYHPMLAAMEQGFLNPGEAVGDEPSAPVNAPPSIMKDESISQRP